MVDGIDDILNDEDDHDVIHEEITSAGRLLTLLRIHIIVM